MKGITNGYLKSSPFEALMLAMVIHTTLRVRSRKIIGNPIMIKHNGLTRTI
jgi:hypothetical protein